jgi:hypothetical protein
MVDRIARRPIKAPVYECTQGTLVEHDGPEVTCYIAQERAVEFRKYDHVVGIQLCACLDAESLERYWLTGPKELQVLGPPRTG